MPVPVYNTNPGGQRNSIICNQLGLNTGPYWPEMQMRGMAQGPGGMGPGMAQSPGGMGPGGMGPGMFSNTNSMGQWIHSINRSKSQTYTTYSGLA